MRDLTITLDDVLERNPCWDRDDVRDYAQQLGWERASAADLLTLRGRLDDADLIWLLCDPRLWPREVWTRLIKGWADRAIRVHLPSALDAAAAEHPDMQHRAALREAAQRCRDEGMQAAEAAARASEAAAWAAEDAAGAAAKSAAWSATRASRSAAEAAEDAAGAAAGARAAAARVADSAAWAAAARAARSAALAARAADARAARSAALAAGADGDERRRQLDDFEQAAKEVRDA